MRTTKAKPVSPQQLKALHASFHTMGYDDDDRHDFILRFTDRRTASTKELTFDEARLLLERLNGDRQQAARKEAKVLCHSIYALSLQISFLNKDYTSDTEEERQINFAKINLFCRTHTKFRKPVTQMTLPELKEVKKQLEAIARKEKEEPTNHIKK